MRTIRRLVTSRRGEKKKKNVRAIVKRMEFKEIVTFFTNNFVKFSFSRENIKLFSFDAQLLLLIRSTATATTAE